MRLVRFGGGGCPTTGGSEQAAAAGGGAGGYALKKIAAASVGASETVTRGAGGAGGVGGTDGSAGGTSSFGAHCSATGGAGGQAGIASPAGLGGAGSGGDLNLAGGDGGNAAVNTGARMIFGQGAASYFRRPERPGRRGPGRHRPRARRLGWVAAEQRRLGGGWRRRRQRHRDRVGVPEVRALIDPRSGRVCELRQEAFAVADPLFWLDVGDEVTTRYTYDGANLVPPPLPSLEEVRLLAIERVEHGAEVELQAALGAKLPASVLLFQALSDELTRFQADQAPTAENYPLLASLVGKRDAVDLQRAAQLVAERRARWLQRATAVEALRLETLEDLEAAQNQEEIDAVLKGLDWGRATSASI